MLQACEKRISTNEVSRFTDKYKLQDKNILRLDTDYFTAPSSEKSVVDSKHQLAPEKIVIEKQVKLLKDDDKISTNECECSDKIANLPKKEIMQPVVQMTDAIGIDSTITQLTRPHQSKRKQKNIFTLNKFKKKK